MNMIKFRSAARHRILLGLGLVLFANFAHGGGLLSVVTVGIGQSCDFADLQAAINAASTQAADARIIRLSRGFNTQSLQINDRNITIDGRWPSCASALPQLGLRQVIDGNGADTVIRMSTPGGSARDVILRGLVVRDGGVDDALNDRGGGLRIEGRIAAQVLETSIGDNAATAGGGIYIAGSLASVTLDEGTIIGNDAANNLPGNGAFVLGPAAAQGGGIYCTGATVTINDARVRLNTSAGNGGGIYLNDCALRIETRPEFINAIGAIALRQNVAAGSGGGIYADNGSSVFWRSLPTGSFGGTAFSNRASDRGGTVFLTGSSNFVGDWIRVESSSADGRGGAFAVQDNSNLILRGGPGFSCTESNCPGIFSTRGVTGGESATLIGGAIYADTGGTVDLRQQQLYDNFANNGSAIHLSGSTTRADLHSVLIARNILYGVGNGTSTIELTSSADAVLRFVTMAGNLRASNQFPGVELALSSIRANGSLSTVELRNSTLWNDGVSLLRFLVGATASGSCVFGHENSSFALTNVIDPQYVNTVGSTPDFSLSPGSPAIDRCAASGANERDIFGRARPQDLPDVPNGFGAYDVGAIETPTNQLFSDGFETP